MRKLIWLVICLVIVALLMALVLQQPPAVLMIQIGAKTISAKLWAVVLAILLALIILYFVIILLSGLFKLPVFVRNKLAHGKAVKQQDRFLQGLEFYLGGDVVGLEKSLSPVIKADNSPWKVCAMLYLLSYIVQNNIDSKEFKVGELVDLLNDSDLDLQQKLQVRFFEAKDLSSHGKYVDAISIWRSLLSDISDNYNLPKSGLINYLDVIVEYGKSCIELGKMDVLQKFIELVVTDNCLHKVFKSQSKLGLSYISSDFKSKCIISAEKVVVEVLDELIHVHSVQLSAKSNSKSNYKSKAKSNAKFKYIEDKDKEDKGKRDKSRGGDGFNLISSCWKIVAESNLCTTKLLLSYVDLLVELNNIGQARSVLESCLGNWSRLSGDYFDAVFAHFAQASYIDLERRLSFAQKIIINKKFKPSYIGLKLMGDLCLESNLKGQALSYYEQSLAVQESSIAYFALANLFLLNNDENKAISTYQKGVVVLV